MVITATGFDLTIMGDVDFRVDGVQVDPADTVTYRGIMFTGLPNLAYVFGYFRASWTLRADIISDFVCRLLAHMGGGRGTVVRSSARLGLRARAVGRPRRLQPRLSDPVDAPHAQAGRQGSVALVDNYDEAKRSSPEADLKDGTLQYC